MAQAAVHANAARSTRRWPVRRRAGLLRMALLWPLNLCLLCFFLFPFYWLTITAVKSPAEVETFPIHWLPSHLYWGNFQAVFTYLHLQTYLANSMLVALTTTCVALVLSVTAGYALAKLPLPAKRTLLVLVVMMVTISGIALVPSLYLLFRDLGWLNTRKALIAPYVASSLPFAIWILTNAFRDIPGELTEQAEVDGCTPLQVLWRVILPLASPSVLTAALIIFLGAWNEFLFAAMFILDVNSNIETAPVALAGAGGSWGVVAAASEIMILPIIAVALLFQNRIVQGLTAGALKG
jgi:ABC-type glycerol-3-phosphate transport system permease component